MSSIFNLAERQFAPPNIVSKQRDELLNFQGRYSSDNTSPYGEPAAARSAPPVSTGHNLGDAPSAPKDITPVLRAPLPTIAGNPAASRSDPAFEPRGTTFSPEAAGATIGGGSSRGANGSNDLFAEVRQRRAREALINEINSDYSNRLQSEIAGMEPDMARGRLLDEELNGPKIGADKWWADGHPYHKHAAWNALPSYWPIYKKEAAIRVLQGLPEEDNRFMPDANAGAFDRAMRVSNGRK